MSTRTSRAAFILTFLFVLAGCGGDSPPAAPAGEVIACATGGTHTLTQECRVEHGGGQLTVHQPDGGFHRLLITGNGVVAADGAEVAQVERTAQGVVVTIGDARYRLPASMTAPEK